MESHVTGDLVRATVASENLDKLLERLREHQGRLISVTPLHGTLEQYFLSRTSEPEAARV
jgi:hypothetical protein